MAGATIRAVSLAPGQALPPHAHRHARLVVVAAGALSESYGSRVAECAASTLIVRPPGLVHGNRAHREGAAYLSVDLPASWLLAHEDLARLVAAPAQLRLPGGGAVARRLRRVLDLADSVSRLALEASILELCAEAVRLGSGERPGREIPGWLRRTREVVDAEFQRRLTLAELAARAGVHPVSLARAFRRHYGRTVAEHLRALRIDRAADLLAGPEPPIATIAQECGFCDQSHFSRLFRRRYGATPGRYRRAAVKIPPAG